MQNVGAEQFDFGTFKAAYDTDSRVKTMVKNFDKNGIEPKTRSALDSEPVASTNPQQSSRDAVGQMAQRATNLGDNL